MKKGPNGSPAGCTSRLPSCGQLRGSRPRNCPQLGPLRPERALPVVLKVGPADSDNHLMKPRRLIAMGCAIALMLLLAGCQFGDGVHAVGPNHFVDSGLYTTVVPDGQHCFWARLDDMAGIEDYQ